jgi:hypothetical protein
MDIAETLNESGDGYDLKVLEVNNLNSAGFYACNIGKMIEALEEMGET